MVIGDKNATLIAIRNSSYGPEYTVDVTCPVCDHTFENTFDMSRLNMKMLDVDPVVPNTNLFCCTLPKSKKEVTFKLLTGLDVAEIDRVDKQRKKNNIIADDFITSTLFNQIVSIDGEDDRNVLLRTVENLSAYDSLDLRSYIAEIVPGVEMEQTIVCPACDSEQEVEVPMGTEFFWPSRGRRSKRR
jgi:hypothetical protein